MPKMPRLAGIVYQVMEPYGMHGVWCVVALREKMEKEQHPR